MLDKPMSQQLTDDDYPDKPDALPYYMADMLRDYVDDDGALAAAAAYIDTLRAFDPPTPTGAVDVSAAGPEGMVVDTRTKAGWTDVLKKVKCGKSDCDCASGDESALHGPYHYRCQRDGDHIEWEYVPKSESPLL